MRKVAIITRTKDRPILLRRAAESIGEQTFDDYVWVIVNDGGDREVVAEIVSHFPEDKLMVIHNLKSVGLEAAANIGLRSRESEYVAIHDDDDTWYPRFLDKTVSYLDARGPSDMEQGVITYSEKVVEEISGQSVRFIMSDPFNTWMTSVELHRMLVGNTFPPISFLYRRSVHEEIGYFDESLPVLGDWDFNIRFILNHDIGLIREILARYHHRPQASQAYSNTVTAGRHMHEHYETVLRNRFLRKDIESGVMGVGFYMNTGWLHASLEARTTQAQALEASLKAKTAEAQALEASLEEKTAEAQALEASLEERTTPAQALEASLEEKTAQAQTLEARLEEKTAQIEELSNTLQAKEGELSMHKKGVDALLRSLAGLALGESCPGLDGGLPGRKLCLNLGCGERPLPDSEDSKWVNIDVGKKADLCLDVRDIGYAFRPNSVDYVFCCHVLEHLTYTEGDKLLQDIYGLLKHGGVLELHMPELAMIIANQDAHIEGIYGAQQDEHDVHKSGWDYDTGKPHRRDLRKTLIEKGFTILRAERHKPAQIGILCAKGETSQRLEWIKTWAMEVYDGIENR